MGRQMRIVPVPLESDPVYFVKREFTPDELEMLVRHTPRVICVRHEPNEIQVTAPDEPLDRLAGMISDDDFDPYGCLIQVYG